MPPFEPVADVDALSEVRSGLRRARFDETNVLATLEAEALPNTKTRLRDRAPYLAKAGGAGAVECLIRLFLLHEAVEEAAIADALDTKLLENVGLVRRDDRTLFATVELLPFGDLLVAADWLDRGSDQVMGVTASTLALLQFTIRRNAESVLDLGTGCGIQAMLAAQHSQRVAAVDVNPRAVRMAEFNARLNGIANIEFASGDLFEPVTGQKFDLVVCNPPFVVGPAVSPVHTSSGEAGDHFCERILREAPSYLNEGGFAQVLCNWVERDDETGRERMTRWLADNGCDAWVLHSHTESAEEYARARARENATAYGEEEMLSGRWMRYLESETITGVNFGVVTMRRGSSANHWIRYDELPGAKGHCGRSIETGFLLHDYIDEHADEKLLDARLKKAPDLKIDELPQEAPNNGKGTTKRIRLETGLTYSVSADEAIANFVDSCSGRSTLRAYAHDLATNKHLSISSLLPGFLSVVRALVELGFLLPVEMASRLDP